MNDDEICLELEGIQSEKTMVKLLTEIRIKWETFGLKIYSGHCKITNLPWEGDLSPRGKIISLN